jgi:hypothetical protein
MDQPFRRVFACSVGRVELWAGEGVCGREGEVCGEV